MSHSFPSEAAVIGDWLVKIAKRMGLSGATMIPGAEGFGHHRKIHSVHSIELTDQPLEAVRSLPRRRRTASLEFLSREGVELFYAKTAVEFDKLGRSSK